MKKKEESLWGSLNTVKCKDTALAIALILIVLALWKNNFLYVKITSVVVVTSMIIPIIFKPFAFFWYGLSYVLGLFVPKVLLSLIFITFVVTVGGLRKLLGKDSMQLKQFKKDTKSVMKTRNLVYTKEHIENPY